MGARISVFQSHGENLREICAVFSSSCKLCTGLCALGRVIHTRTSRTDRKEDLLPPRCRRPSRAESPSLVPAQKTRHVFPVKRPQSRFGAAVSWAGGKFHLSRAGT